MNRLNWRVLVALLAALALALVLLPGTTGAGEAADDEIENPEDASLVTLSIPDAETLEILVDRGYDLDHDLNKEGSSYTISAVVQNDEVASIEALGVGIDVQLTSEEAEALRVSMMAERQETLDANEALAAELEVEDVDTVVIARADYYTSSGDTQYLSVEAKTTDENGASLTLEWDAGPGTAIGDGGSSTLSAYNDAGQYLYHRRAINLGDGAVPTMVRVTSSNGGVAEAEVTEWLPTDFPERNNRYFEGFLDHYPDAYEMNEIIEDMAAQFPEIAEVVDLPYLTNGYRYPAQALSGGSSSQRVGLDSHVWGHEGGNDYTIAYVNPGTADAPLSVAVSGNDIVVSLATDSATTATSTAAEVVAALNADVAASALVLAYTYRGNVGDGLVVAAAPVNLTDGLDAPDHVLREPFQVKMLRIGKYRDGSKTGVMSYSQEHAREWQTPLVQIETAYRLLNNYYTDDATKKIVDNLDIFIMPTANPDGMLYSYYDDAFKRNNMTRYCGVGEQNDMNNRDNWGVNINRNYEIGSYFDGYSGATPSCSSDNSSGPSELSEPESKNVDWIPTEFENIVFSMNIHSSGNYFMWSPGSYISNGRIPLERPDFGTEEYFYSASEDILTAIKQYRGLSVIPARTGPIIDVLYSAAGNSGDHLYYKHGLYAWNFEVGTSFQPQWDEAYNQMMEFSNGIVGLFDVALDWTRDRRAPTAWVEQPGSGTYSEPVGITFGYDEPVNIYYTLDGSNPTFDSTKYEAAGIREGGETLTISETTTIKWFAVDQSGNIQGKYNPGRNNAPSETITITD